MRAMRPNNTDGGNGRCRCVGCFVCSCEGRARHSERRSRWPAVIVGGLRRGRCSQRVIFGGRVSAQGTNAQHALPRTPGHAMPSRAIGRSTPKPYMETSNRSTTYQTDRPTPPYAAITTMLQLRLCGGKLLVAVTRQRRYGPSRLRFSAGMSPLPGGR